MDDQTQNPSQSTIPQASPPVQTGITSVQQEETQEQQSSQQDQQMPVSTPVGSKEGGPVATNAAETLAPSTPEMEVSPELQEMGVEAKSEIPSLPEAVEKIGVKQAKESVSVSTVSGSGVTLPMTKIQAQQIIKTHKDIRESLLWLALLIFRQWQLLEKKEHLVPKEAA